jgi:F420H(2)-dependent quinone reductase
MSAWQKIFPRWHVFFYRLTGGMIGGRMAGQTVLLLRTVGRRSGKPRTIPINYFPDAGRYVVVASNWGRGDNPDWYENLKARPAAVVQVGRREWKVQARDAEGADYPRLWELVTARNPYYAGYQEQTRRRIPIVILEPMLLKNS